MIDRIFELVAERARQFGLAPQQVLERTPPGGLRPPGRISPNGSCRLIAACDGWIALNLARPEDLDVVPALTGSTGEPWQALTEVAAHETANGFRDRAAELQLPVAVIGESPALALSGSIGSDAPRRVADLSALWAGPLCGSLLARAGAEVTRIISTGRPDPVALTDPDLDCRLNAGKDRIELDLRVQEGRRALVDILKEADAVITSARPAALARLGLVPEQFPHLTWVAITAHGFDGAAGQRVGFGDDCAAAGGLVDWRKGEPCFAGDALADPLTGLEAANAVLSGKRGFIGIPMAGVAAAYREQLA